MKKNLIKILKKEFNEKEEDFLFAYLFGSLAQKTYSKSSDIDIAVYLNAEVERHFFDIKIDLYLRLSRALKRNDIDIVIMNQCKNIILLNRIITHGQVIHEKNESIRLEYEQKILHSAIDFKTQRKMAMEG
ncbi:MAG: nucleotidyltransferase domain-containing protein [Proteobacteria bacterium]|nr:nucleotidyltransferase domain-containing protein [Pseudomonadota bacterium]